MKTVKIMCTVFITLVAAMIAYKVYSDYNNDRTAKVELQQEQLSYAKERQSKADVLASSMMDKAKSEADEAATNESVTESSINAQMSSESAKQESESIQFSISESIEESKQDTELQATIDDGLNRTSTTATP